MPLHKACLFALVLVAALAVGRPAQEPPDERETAYRWFDTLGLNDGLSKPLIRFERWWGDKPDPKSISAEYGFLVAETPKSFTVLNPFLRQETFQRQGDSTGARFASADFARYAADLLRARSKPSPEELEDGLWAGPYNPVDLFVISRAAALRGKDDLAKRLFELSKKAKSLESGTYLETLKNEIGDWRLGYISSDMGELEISRSELSRRLAVFVEHFPKNKNIDLARRWIDGLADIERAEQVRSLQPAKAWNQMTAQEQIEELVYQLQDQNGRTLMHPGSCDVFADPRYGKSPADRLVKYGYRAVPRLIRALKDERISRSVDQNYHGKLDGVLCVGEVALQVVERITHRRFVLPDGTDYSDWARCLPLYERQVQTWWAQYEAHGEKRVLAADVATGQWWASGELDVLAGKYPEAAIDAIVKGLKKADSSQTKTMYVAALRQCKTGSALALARCIMCDAKEPDVRVAAASVVAWKDLPAAIAAMKREWARAISPRGDRESAAAVVGFLLCCGRAELVDSVRQSLPKLPFQVRAGIVDTFMTDTLPVIASDLQMSIELPKPDRKHAAAYSAAVEHLLVTELLDTECYNGASMGGPFGDFVDPRLCDLVAYDLSALWPKRYRFCNDPSPFRMDVQRLTSLNVWRKAHGLRALKLPTRPKIALVPTGTARSLIAAALNAPNDVTRKKATNAIRRLRLGVLPAVQKALAGLPNNHPARWEMLSLAASLACTVREVRFTGSPVPASFQSFLTSYRGKPLTSDGLVEALRKMGDLVSRSRLDCSLVGVREGDGTGFSLTLESRLGAKRGKDAHRDFSELLRIDTEYLNQGFGSGIDWPSDEPRFGRALHKALSSNPKSVVAFAYRWAIETD